MNGRRGWAGAARLAGVLWMAWAAGTGCRREAGPGNAVILLKQTPSEGSVLRNQDRILWEWSDAISPAWNSSGPSTGEVTVVPPVPGRIDWLAPSAMAFTPDRPWPEVSNILVTVALPSSLAGRPFIPATYAFKGPLSRPGPEAGFGVRSVEPEEEGASAALRVLFTGPPAPNWNRYVKVEPSTNLTWESGTGALARIRGLVPGERVELTFAAGLPALSGAVLTQELAMAVQVPDLRTRLRFQDRGHYLPTAGSRKLALESVNVKVLTVSVWKIYTNNMSEFARNSNLYSDQEGRWIWNQAMPQGDEITNRTVRVVPGRNQVRQTLLDMGELTGHADSGLFYVAVEDADERSHLAAHKAVMLTDLGLSIIRNNRDVLVWALSISTGEPVAGVTVTAFSSKNQPVGSAVTDEHGLAMIIADSRPALGIVTGEKGSSFAMIKLDEALVQGAVMESGRAFLEQGYEAFLYADRGIYRPGETAHIRALVRGPLLACPPAFPVQLTVRRPDGLIAARQTALLSAEGTADFDWLCLAEALTGRYGLELEAGDRVAGSLSLMIEDFVPPTLAVSVTGPAGRVLLGEPVRATVEARHLFGSPAAGKRVTLRARLGPAPFQPASCPDFVFGDARREPVWRTVECGEKRLDEAGRADFAVPLPPGLSPAAALDCTLAATVLEDSGRACPAVASFAVDAQNRYIGLKPLAESWSAQAPVRYDAVLVAPDGSRIDGEPLAWSLSRVTWIWREEQDPGSNSRFRYDSVREPVRDGLTGPTSNGVASIVWDHGLAGEYELVVSSTSGAAAASAAFYVPDGSGWGGTGFRQPDRVAVRFDRESYQVGDEAVVTLQAPFPGRVLISLGNDRIRSPRVAEMSHTTYEYRFTVEAEHWPNVYVRAIVVRPLAGTPPGKDMTVVRATGQASLKVNRPEAAFRVALNVPGRLKPDSPLAAEVAVTDAQGQPVSCEVTLAAVDEGILQLTAYGTPDPLGFFEAARGLNAWLHDGYSMLLGDPDVAARLKTGGDAMGVEMAGRLNPVRTRRFIPIALWSGTLRTGPDGRASVAFPVPEFSGRLRVTAVAAGTNGFGSASKAVEVRRDWVVQSGLPRAAAPGDRISMICQVFNEGAEAGEAALEVTASGALAGRSSESVALAPGENKGVTISLAASSVGVGLVRLAVQAGTDQWEETVEIPVRPPWPRVTLAGTGALAPGQAATLDLPGEWISNWGTGRLVCSGSPGLENLGALEFLDGYPHGCLEQTLSKAFPYLAAADLLAATGQGYRDPAWIRERVESGIAGVLSMQTGGGGFSLWPREMEVYDWGTAYAVLFLARAREAGYRVPEESINRACSFLETRLGGWLNERQPRGGAYAAAALTALGAAGRPDQAALSRLMREEEHLDADSRGWLIQALLASGRRGEAAVALERLSGKAPGGSFREVGEALASSVRTDALLLDGWLQIDPASPNVPILVNRLIRSQHGGSWGTTQDNAWALLALGRYARHRPPGHESCRGLASRADGGDTWLLSETNDLAFPDPAILRRMTLRNAGAGTLFYAWTAAGVPREGVIPEEDHGMRIRRQVLALDGRPLEGRTFKQGDVAVVKLTVEGVLRTLDNLVIEELLPGGLEIENPNLPNGYGAFIPENDDRLAIRYLTLRDDRLIAFTGPVNSGNLYYLVRAVTPGEYAWAPVTAACMYDPSLNSLFGGGRITVEP